MEAPSPVPARSFWQTLVREPLLHFVLLGGLIFAVDELLLAERDNPYLIVIAPALENELRVNFRAAQGREPTPADLKLLRERWVDNEILYREGLAQRLEQGDSALRQRVIGKVLNLIEANVRVPQAREAELRAWFEQHRAQYDSPARFDFTEAPLAAGADEAAAQRLLATLNLAPSDEVRGNLRLLAGRPLNTLVDGFGAAFADALEKAPLGVWQVLPAKAGPRVVRLDYRTQAAPSSFDAVRLQVARDYREAQAQQLRAAAVRELAEKYTIRLAGGES